MFIKQTVRLLVGLNVRVEMRKLCPTKRQLLNNTARNSTRFENLSTFSHIVTFSCLYLYFLHLVPYCLSITLILLTLTARPEFLDAEQTLRRWRVCGRTAMWCYMSDIRRFWNKPLLQLSFSKLSLWIWDEVSSESCCSSLYITG